MKRRNFSGQTTRLVNMIRTISLSTVLATSFVSTTFAETVSATQTAHYDIAANDLGAALAIFATQSGVVLSFDTDLTKGLKSTDLKGEYSIVQGFEQLLKGTNLQLLQRADGSLTLQKVQAKPQPVQARDMGQLKTIDVTASASRRAVTNDANVAQLPVITVNAEQNGSAEDGYLVKNITGVGIWGERSLQDTPYSMNVVSGSLIENTIAGDMNQIFKMNPNTQETRNNWTNTSDSQYVIMRGLEVTNPVINGIPYADRVTSLPTMQDIERVEIINGATGFLYGGGRVGGAINYITKKPTIENLRNLTLGSYGGESYFAHLDLGGQFDQNHVFGYRINAHYQDGELPVKTTKENKAVSVVLDYKPTDNFTTDLKYSYKHNFSQGVASFIYLQQPFNEYILGVKKNQSYSPDWVEYELNSNKIENSIQWKINDIFSLRSNLIYEKAKNRGDDSRVYLADDVVLANYHSRFYKGAWQENENKAANLYLDSDFNTFGIGHKLTVGYALSSNKISNSLDSWQAYFTSVDTTLDGFKNLPRPSWEEWGKIGISPITPSSKLEYQNILIGDDIKFNNQFSALLGINYATTKSTNYRAVTPTLSTYDKSVATPTASLIYKLIEDMTTYATYIESLEAGTFVGNRFENENEILDPYISKQYEVGAKYNFNDRALLTASLFRIEKVNSNEKQILPLPNKPTLMQEGLQVHQGLEFGLTGKITDNFTLITGGTLLDLSVEEATDQSLIGKKPVNAASHMAKLYAEYTVPDIEGLTLTGGVYYTGKSYATASNTDILPEYTLFDAGIRYLTKFGQYPTTFNLNATNLTDKVYWTRYLMVGDPRTVAFSIKTQF